MRRWVPSDEAEGTEVDISIAAYYNYLMLVKIQIVDEWNLENLNRERGSKSARAMPLFALHPTEEFYFRYSPTLE